MVFPWFSHGFPAWSTVVASCKSSGMLSCARRWATLRSSCGAFLVGAVAGGHPGEMAIVYWKTWENIEKYRRIW